MTFREGQLRSMKWGVRVNSFDKDGRRVVKMSDMFERETVNNQKRIIRELKGIREALEALVKVEQSFAVTDVRVAGADLDGDDVDPFDDANG